MCYEATSCLHNYSKFIRRFKKNKLFLCVSFDYSNNDLCVLYSDIFPHLLEHLPGTSFLCVLGGSEGAWAIIIDDNSP